MTPTCLEQVDPGALPNPIPICKRWDLSDRPDDPLMIEATDPRHGKNPPTGTALVGFNGAPGANPINGHEWLPFDDLQFACIFPLAEPRDCGSSTKPPGCACEDVYPGNPGYFANNPLCQDATGSYTMVQRYAGAHPSTRQLEVLRDLGPNGIVASICPKITTGDPEASGYGYNPAIRALTERFIPTDGAPFDLWCQDRPMIIDDDGRASCRVLQVTFGRFFGEPYCPCDEPGFAPVSSSVREAAMAAGEAHGLCGESLGTPYCDRMCVCEPQQLSGAEAVACQTEVEPNAKITGYCPIVAIKGIGNPELGHWCYGTNGLLRFLGLPDRVTLMAVCQR